MGANASKVPKEVKKACRKQVRGFKWERKTYKDEMFPQQFWDLQLLSLTLSACGISTGMFALLLLRKSPPADQQNSYSSQKNI